MPPKKEKEPPRRRIPPATDGSPIVPPAREFDKDPPLPGKEDDEEDEGGEDEKDEDEAPKTWRRPRPRDAEDEESAFVTDSDVKKAGKSSFGGDKEPYEPGFIAELIAGAGEKLHEVEYGLTGHPVFQHSKADERIWRALGQYVEKTLDVSKYGIVILVVVLLGSESMKIAVYAKWRADEEKKAKGKKGKK